MAQILLHGQKFSYTVNRKFIRSLNLRLKSSTSFVINCPHLTPDFIITKFIQDHSVWITKNASRFISPTPISALKTLSILDKPYEIIVRKTTRDSVVIFKDEQKIYANCTGQIKKLLDQKLRPFSLSLINQELQNLADRYGFHYRHVSVRNTTSRFGSCSHVGNLNFNWQIILFPFPIFQHILLHELTHLKIKNHSAKFWHQLSLYDPDYLYHRHWLKKEANRFLIF